MNKCAEDYKTCGHCKVCFDGPPGDEARPYCDKAGLFTMLAGLDMCPNAPWPNDLPAESKPLRNCDVGTPAEQAERYHDFCKAHKCCHCPCREWRDREKRPGDLVCEFAWMNLPYEPEDKHEEGNQV